jgi:hypothetical protein
MSPPTTDPRIIVLISEKEGADFLPGRDGTLALARSTWFDTYPGRGATILRGGPAPLDHRQHQWRVLQALVELTLGCRQRLAINVKRVSRWQPIYPNGKLRAHGNRSYGGCLILTLRSAGK